MSAIRALPVSTHLVEVRLRPEFADAEGAGALALLQAQGLTCLKEARLSRLYEIKGPLSANQAQQAAKDLLCDPVTQEFRLLAPASAPLNGMNHWRVEVWLKPTVCDPVGETVLSALSETALPRPESVRCGLAYRLVGRAHKTQLERAVPRSLANPLIHRFAVSETHP